jgi:hypothetical protein
MTRLEELEKEVELLKQIVELKAKILEHENKLQVMNPVYVPVYPQFPPWGTYISIGTGTTEKNGEKGLTYYLS